MRQCAIVEKAGEVVGEYCWTLPTAHPLVNLAIFTVTFLALMFGVAWLRKPAPPTKEPETE